jgi:tyrosyl-tRNA synthetase
MKKQAIQEILDAFSRTIEDLFSLKEFEDILNSGRQLRIKYGVDVTAPTLHIGHAVNLWMMRKLQDCGHKVLFLIGDFTTQIGDPTGKNKTRPVISQEEIEKNTKEFIKQVKTVLRFDDPNLIEIRKNSEWFGSMPTAEFLKLLSLVTHARLISRDMFQCRIEGEQDIYMHEMVYPILQGYDSFMLESDLTIIGSDQLFNEMLGRFYQEKFNQSSQVIITTKITPGIDGKEKQSKSLGNYIGLAHSPRDKFGRTMSIPDNLIIDYLKIYTDVPSDKIREIENSLSLDPMGGKKFLAREIVARYHGIDIAKKEQEWFERVFSKRKIPQNIPEVHIGAKEHALFEILRKCYDENVSNSAINRLIKQRAVKVNGNVNADGDSLIVIPEAGLNVKVGKKKWFKILA